MTADKKLRICVTTTRQDLEDEFNVEQPIRSVKMQALTGIFDIDEADQYQLVYEDTELDDQEKIETYADQFDWEDGVCLDLKKILTAI